MSIKLLISLTLFIIYGLNCSYTFIKILAAICAMAMIIFIYVDDVKFYKKLDRIAAGDKNIKL